LVKTKPPVTLIAQCGFVLTKPCDLRTYLAINVTGGSVLTKPCDLRTYLAINVTGGLEGLV
jgi:hypothetical protein